MRVAVALRAVALLVTIAVIGTGTSSAEPIPANPHNLTGTWDLNTWLSDPGDEIAQELRVDLGPANHYDLLNAAEQGPRPRGTMGRRDDERTRATALPADRPLLKPDDQRRLQTLLEIVRMPAATLSISQDGDTIGITDPARGTWTFHANGRTEKQTFDSGVVEETTRWEGPQLITDYDAGHGVTLRFSYMLVPPSGALLVRVSVVKPGNDTAPFVLRHVYDKGEMKTAQRK